MNLKEKESGKRGARRLEKLEKSRGGYGLARLFGSDEEVAPKRARRPKFESVRAQSAKRVARRAAQSAKRLEKLEKSRGGYGLGNLFAEPKEPKKKRTKKAKAVPAVENMTPGERAQYEAGKVANRLYGAKAKAPKYT